MTRIAVLLCGGLGIALVTRAALFYRSTDRLSQGLAILIGLGLSLGVVELFARAWRVERLSRELRLSTSEGPLDSLESLSKELRALFQRRLSGGTVQRPAAWFTTYLLGLLVMLGMLGTFLGLFESLRGAREALTTSGDVDALRSALISPLQGLSRAFGLSAAGVSASATLGLAAVFVRRAESQLAEAITAVASGPLASKSIAGRQLIALEALATHAPDLALSARALQQATEQLSALRDDLTASQHRAAESSAQALRAAAAQLSGDLSTGLDRATQATDQALRPLYDHAAARLCEVTEQHQRSGHLLQEQAQKLEALRRDLIASQDKIADRSVEAFLVSAEQVRGDLRAGIDRAAQATNDAVRPLVDQISKRMAAIAEQQREAVRALEQETKELQALHAELLETQRSSSERAAQALEASSARATDAIRATAGEIRQDLSTGIERAASATSAVVRPLIDQVALRLEETAEQQRSAAKALEQESLQLQSLRRDLREAEEASSTRTTEAIRATAGEIRQDLSAAIDRTAQATERAIGPLFDRLAERASSAAQESYGRWTERLEHESIDREQAQLRHLEEIRAALRETSESLAKELRSTVQQLGQAEQERARALGESLTQTVVSVEESARALTEADADRLRTLRAAAEQVRVEIEQRSEAERERAEHLAELVTRVTEALESAELQVSARMQEQVDRLASNLAEYVKSLEAAEAVHAAQAGSTLEKLDQTLAAHLQELGKGLSAPLAEVTIAARKAPEAAALLVESARRNLEQQAELDRAREKQTEALLKRLSEAADAVAVSATTQGEQLHGFLLEAEQRNARSEEQSTARMGALLEGMNAMLEQQAERLAAFEKRLEAARGESAQALAERVAEHARVLGESLSATAAVVRDAGDLVRAGGAEMNSVAEMFTAAVDQYRAASDSLLKGLGPIEDALERDGQRDTVDLLGVYLDQTREVFDSSLRFQKELFTELRALRAGRNSAEA